MMYVQYVLLCAVSVTFGSYFWLMTSFLIGLRRNNEPPAYTGPSDFAVSCVIPFRNEEKHLCELIRGLKEQTYTNYEIILVNDHSTDTSYELAQKLIENSAAFKLINNNGHGKKSALATGIEMAQYKYIVFSDADCIHPGSWLQSIVNTLKSEGDIDLLVGPVTLTDPGSFFDKFQLLDFLSLIISGAGAIGINNPIMCNGANLIVKKDVWLLAKKEIQNGFLSGDDIFLLQYCKATGKKISFLNDAKGIVRTYPASSVRSFFYQRARWASKSKGYTDKFTLFVAWIVFLCNLNIATLPATFFFVPHVFYTTFVLFLAKQGFDFVLLKQGGKQLNVNIKFIETFGVSIIYPYYIATSVLLAMFKKVPWKGRVEKPQRFYDDIIMK